MIDGVLLAAGVAASAVATLRWLLVAQREHYLAGAGTRFARRWWTSSLANIVLLTLAVAAAAASFSWPRVGLAAAAVATAAPLGLPLRGRAPGPLAWTRRLRTLAAIAAVLYLLSVAVGWALGFGAPVAVVGALAAPLLVDAALVIAAPLERRLARRWIEQAERRLRQVAPRVVGITGSYGKTSTKNYVAHLVEGSRAVVASPRSFNNAAGLAIAVNNHLVPGTEVFVAEMGTYGPGEIAAMREWIRPDISVITAIGPVHLERFHSEGRIVEAKSEILVDAAVAVLNIDDERLADVAERLQGEGRRVVRCSAKDAGADVCARREDGALRVSSSGREVACVADVDAHPLNVACAVAVALELGASADSVGERVASLPQVPNRLTVGTAASGATIVDDTFNSNPAGAAAALDVARRHARSEGKLVVVTPGMIELGPRQRAENAAFAKHAGASASHFLIVGRTNRAALLEGARGEKADVICVGSRQDAVEWVKAHLAAGDVALYENDLPDHYP